MPIFRSGLRSLATTFRPNADTLSATAIVASIASGRGLSALTIIWLADIAELLTAYTMERTRRAIREMLAVGEESVWRLRADGSEERVDLDQVRAEDRVMVHTGEKISVDGLVEPAKRRSIRPRSPANTCRCGRPRGTRFLPEPWSRAADW